MDNYKNKCSLQNVCSLEFVESTKRWKRLSNFIYNIGILNYIKSISEILTTTNKNINETKRIILKSR